MSRNQPSARPAGRPLGRVRPSNIVLLALLPLVVYLFASDADYQDALTFLLPGLRYTISVTLLGYGLAAVLGLSLALLLLLKPGKRTLPTFFVVACVGLVVGTALLFTPKTQLVLAGAAEGRVAIVRGTPARIAEQVQEGTFAEGAQERRFLSALDTSAALAYLEEGRVTAVLLPPDEVPAELPELWRFTFLPDAARNPAFLAIGMGVAFLLLGFAGWQTGHHPLSVFAEVYVDLIRGVPMLVVVLFIGFVIPGALRDLTGGRIVIRDDLLRGVLAIAIGYAAYMAEIFRAGIEAIPKGQIEAARSLGLTAAQTARFVTLPQAIRIVLPPLGNEFIAMLKDTALLSVIGVGDVTQKAREFGAATLNLFPPYNSAAVVYIALTLAASSLLKSLERRAAWTR
ncbi:MAG TPA: amino acid ABC transporter permease [Trueperaceae bacterium]